MPDRIISKILIIDDSNDDFEVLKENLKDAYRASSRAVYIDKCNDLRTASVLVETENWDCVIVDEFIGNHGRGSAWLEEMYSRGKKFPAVIVTNAERLSLPVDVLCKMTDNTCQFLPKDHISPSRLRQVMDAALPAHIDVLLIDDDEDDLLLMELIARNALHEVGTCHIECVHSFERAQFALMDSRFDLIVSDFRLDGDHNATELRPAITAMEQRTECKAKYVIVSGAGQASVAGIPEADGGPVFSKKQLQQPAFASHLQHLILH